MIKKTGYLEVIAGPMYCGKTEELIRQVKRAKIGKRKIQAFKHKIDIRYGADKKLYSHGGITFECEVIECAKDIAKKVKNSTEIVAIDEAQWLGEDLIPVVQQLLDNGKHIIITGLALTFDFQPFPPIPTLMALADKVTKLTSICSICGAEAVYHTKVTKGETLDPLIIDPIHVKSLKDNVFEARCRKCYRK